MSKQNTQSIVEQIDRQAEVEIRLVLSSLLYETIITKNLHFSNECTDKNLILLGDIYIGAFLTPCDFF